MTSEEGSAPRKSSRRSDRRLNELQGASFPAPLIFVICFGHNLLRFDMEQHYAVAAALEMFDSKQAVPSVREAAKHLGLSHGECYAALISEKACALFSCRRFAALHSNFNFEP